MAGMQIATRARRKRAEPETEFHKAVAQYLDRALPPECWWTTFPAGGGGKARGGKLKACGLKAGVADILILLPCKDALVRATDLLWLELKADKGTLSPAQKSFVKRMSGFVGVSAWICKTLDDVYWALDASGIKPGAPVRGRIAA